jgi:predicted ATPase
LSEPRTNLPLSLGRFIGRGADLDHLVGRLADGERLLTITGTAGMGKTRLAVELARRLASGPLAREVWFCDLTDADDVASTAGAVARVLDVPVGGREGASDPVERIGHALDGRSPIVLVLDNFEQLLPSGKAAIEKWLTLAPRAQLVVTSSERLRLDG